MLQPYTESATTFSDIQFLYFLYFVMPQKTRYHSTVLYEVVIMIINTKLLQNSFKNVFKLVQKCTNFSTS